MQKLANAIRQVKVQRITLDIVEAPEVLVQAIPHSLVREWDFLATTALGAKGSTVFPDADEVKSLATAIALLNEHSHTKQIFIDPMRLNEAATNELPKCFIHKPHRVKLCSEPSPLTTPWPHQESQAVSSVATPPVLVNAGETSLSDQEYAKLLVYLVHTIGTGDVRAIQTMIRTELVHCSQKQFDFCRQTAEALAPFNTVSRAAAQEVLKLTFPISVEPQEQPTPPGPVPSEHPSPADAHQPPPGDSVDFPDLVVKLPKYISAGSSTAPNPLCSGNGQLVSLSTSQKNTLRRIALNYQFDPSESVKAVARATLDLLRE